ncbi:hypothetical protein [Kaarinaea lacus]
MKTQNMMHLLLAALLVVVVVDSHAGVTFTDINPNSSTLDPIDADGASGGRTNGLASVPGDNTTFYAATEWGGLYKSTDSGLTWFRLDGHLPVATWDIVVDPANTNRVFATSLYDGRVNPISGIQISNDAGVTWSHPLTAHPDPALEGTAIDNTPDASFACNNARRTEPSAFGIALSPDVPQTVYVGTNCGLAISNDSGVTWRFIDPSPADAADNVWDVVAQAGGIVDVCGDDGHMRSMDGGITWNPGSGLPSGRCSITTSPDETYVLFVAAGDNNIYETDDGGASWINMGTPDRRRQGRIPFVAVNDRTGTAFDLWYGDVSVFRGGCTTPATPAPGGVARCPAGRAAPATPPPAGWAGPFTRSAGAHDDAGYIVFDSSVAVDACPMIVSSDGGVFRNTDFGVDCQNPDWEQPNTTPHALWIYGMDGADQTGDDAEDLYFGTQDNGTFASTDAGVAAPSWFNRDCCDSFDIVADTIRVISTLCCGYSIRYSNPGMTGTTTIATNPPGGTTAFNFIDFIEQYGVNQYIAVSGSGAYITDDITASPVVWTQLGTASTPAGGFCGIHVSQSGGVPTFYAQTFCVPSTNSIFEALGTGQLWKYTGTDPGGTWQRVDNNDGVTGGFGIVAVAPTDPNRIYASNLALAGPRMVFSTDGGLTWNNDAVLDARMTANGVFKYQNQAGPTPQPQLNGYIQPSLLQFHPTNPDIIVAGGRDSGVFLTVNGGANWGLLTDPINSDTSGVPHLPRPWFAYFDLEPSDNPGELNLYVGTQGRGVWRLAIDNQPPVAQICADVTAECAGATTDVVVDGSCSSDPDGDPVSYQWSSGTCTFDDATAVNPSASCPLGVNTVTLVVTDPIGASSAPYDAQVIVEDTTPPLLSVSMTPDTLWPPNHKLVPVTAGITVTDSCDANPAVILFSAVSNEPDNSLGDGNTVDDIQDADIGTDDRELLLRAERQGPGSGRIYTITYEAEDSSGNSSQQEGTVIVPHDQGL